MSADLFLFEKFKEALGKEPVWDRKDYPYRHSSSDVSIIVNNFGIATLIGPHQGYTCHVKKIQVSGITPDTVSAGTGNVFVTSKDIRDATALSGCPIAGWRDRAFQIPLVASYVEDELVALPGEAIFVAFNGATNGQMYVASMQATMLPNNKAYGYGITSNGRPWE